MHVLAKPDRFLKKPGTVRIERHPSVRETLGDGRDRFNLLLPVKNPTLQFEVGEPVIFMGRLG